MASMAKFGKWKWDTELMGKKEEKKSNGIQQFIRFELKSMNRTRGGRQIISRPVQQKSEVKQLGNGSIRVQ